MIIRLVNDTQYNLFKSDERQLCTGLLHSEFRCQCKHPSCKYTPIRGIFIEAYEKLRMKLNIPLKINSGYRCTYHNHDIGGTPRSMHQSGLAIDIAYTGALLNYPPDIVLKHITESGFHMSYFDDKKNFFHMQTIRG